MVGAGTNRSRGGGINRREGRCIIIMEFVYDKARELTAQSEFQSTSLKVIWFCGRVMEVTLGERERDR